MAVEYVVQRRTFGGAGLTVTLDGAEELQEVLERAGAPKTFRRSMEELARAIAKDAAENQIIRGGRFKGAGGGLSDAPPHPSKLTSRSGRLRGSLTGEEGIDKSGLPRWIDVGSDVEYAAVHELGQTVTQTVPSHTRTSAFGRTTQPFTVPSYTRRVSYPKRPFLEPAFRKVGPTWPDIVRKQLDRELAGR